MKCLKHHAQRLATGLLLGTCAVHFAHAATDCSQVTQIPVSECQELLNFYNSTGGANWRYNSGWNETDSPCKPWFGIGCGDGHVRSILLTNNNLVGTLPDLNLPNLESLVIGTPLTLLHQNQLGNIPNFTNLPSLKKLHIHNSNLTGTIPDFENLPNLQELKLYLNQLSGSIPDFNNLPNLQYLLLDSNQLSGSIPNFTNLPNLQYLSLSSNKLSGSIPNFNALPNLTRLHLAKNQLSGTVPNLSNLSNLEISLYENCGLTAYDAAQETVLNGKDSRWKERNSNCGVVSQCATFTPPAVNIPCVNVGGTVYKAGMNLIATLPTMRFEVDMSSLQPSNLIPNEQCAVFPAPNTLDHLRINCLDLGDKYWVDLKLVNANPIQFDLVNYAKN